MYSECGRISPSMTMEDFKMNIDPFFTMVSKHVPDKSVRSLERWKVRVRWRLHAYLRKIKEEVDAAARDPNAPTCTDPDKIEEFLLS